MSGIIRLTEANSYLGPDAVFTSSTLCITSHKLADVPEKKEQALQMQSRAPIVGMGPENRARHSGLMANTDG